MGCNFGSKPMKRGRHDSWWPQDKNKTAAQENPAILGFEDRETFFPWVNMEKTLWNVANHVPNDNHTVNSIALGAGWFLMKFFMWANGIMTEHSSIKAVIYGPKWYRPGSGVSHKYNRYFHSFKAKSSDSIWRNSEKLHREGLFSWALNKDQKKSVKLTGVRSSFLTVKD